MPDIDMACLDDDPHCVMCLLVTAELASNGACEDTDDCKARIVACLLDDLADLTDLSVATGMGKQAICNAAARNADFPAPLVSLVTTRLWSRQAVVQWRASRLETPTR